MATTRRDNINLGLASLGGVLEYFDFQVYVFVAGAVSVAFFPAGASPWLAQVQAFGIYALGYLIRPVAGIVIGHFGDRIGRKRLFVFTVMLMSVPTLLMGLLPTYAMVGWLAPALLLFLRLLQGCAVGGELPAAATFVCEHAPARRLGFSSAVLSAVINCGLLLGAGAAALAAWVAARDPSWAQLAWRLPFVLGGLFGLVAAYLRRHLQETPLFEQRQREGHAPTRLPLGVVVRDYRLQCVFALMLVFMLSSTTGPYFQFLPTYLVSALHFDRGLVFTANTLGTLAFVCAIPLWGMLRDRIGWSAAIASGALVGGAASIWFFGFVAGLGPTDNRLILAYAVVGLCSGITHAVIFGLITGLFPTSIRQSGFAFPYSIGTAVFTGLTPLTLQWLSGSFGLRAPAYQYLAACAVGLGVAAWVRTMPLFLGEGTAGEAEQAAARVAAV